MGEGRIVELRKNLKRNHVLKIIRYDTEVSRYELKKKTGYSMTTVLNIIHELVDRDLIYEEESQEAKVGRRPTWLHINPSGGFFIGVEFNAEMMVCVVLDFAAQVIYSDKQIIKPEFSAAHILEMITTEIEKALAFLQGKQDKVFGIGIGLPGFIDKESGIGIYYAHLPCWKEVKVRGYLESRGYHHISIENNVNAMALAYKWLWYDGDCQDFLFISIRSGIRMSCVLNNKLYYGQNGTAGEIGHIQVREGSRRCSCGKHGCLDTEASNAGIIQKVREGIEQGKYQNLLVLAQGDVERIDIDLYTQSVQAGHSDSIEQLRETAAYIGDALSAVINTLNPAMVVLSGRLVKAGDAFLDEIQRRIQNQTIFVNQRNLLLRTCVFDDTIGAIGAAALIMQEEFEVMDRPV